MMNLSLFNHQSLPDTNHSSSTVHPIDLGPAPPGPGPQLQDGGSSPSKGSPPVRKNSITFRTAVNKVRDLPGAGPRWVPMVRTPGPPGYPRSVAVVMAGHLPLIMIQKHLKDDMIADMSCSRWVIMLFPMIVHTDYE